MMSIFNSGGENLIGDITTPSGYTVSEFMIDEIDWAKSLGGKISMGIIIQDRISVSIDYLGLGTHNVVGRYKTDTYTSEDFSKTLNIHMLTLTAGLNF